MAKGKRLSSDQIVTIYLLAKKDNMPYSDIERKMGLGQGTVWSVMNTIPKYFATRGNKIKHAATNYKHAVSQIRAINMRRAKEAKQHATQDTLPEEQTPVTNGKADHRTALKTAYAQFENALQNFIEAEFAERNHDLLEENKRLKEENQSMEDAFQEARNSNWIDNLFKKGAKTNHG